MRIIACDRAHAGAVLAILNEAIENSTALYDYRLRTPAMMDAWYDAKEQAGHPIIGVVDAAGELLGFGSYGRVSGLAGIQGTALSTHSMSNVLIAARVSAGCCWPNSLRWRCARITTC